MLQNYVILLIEPMGHLMHLRLRLLQSQDLMRQILHLVKLLITLHLQFIYNRLLLLYLHQLLLVLMLQVHQLAFLARRLLILRNCLTTDRFDALVKQGKEILPIVVAVATLIVLPPLIAQEIADDFLEELFRVGGAATLNLPELV